MSYQDLPRTLEVFADAGGRVIIEPSDGAIRLTVIDDDGAGGDSYLEFDDKKARELHEELTWYVLGSESGFHLEAGERESLHARAEGSRMELWCCVCDDAGDEAAFTIWLNAAEGLELLALLTTTMIRERIDFA